jgi:fumarylacetoacetase
MINETHDPNLKTWIEGAERHREFPIQNLPLCIFQRAGETPRGGTAIGSWILDHAALTTSGVLTGEELRLATVVSQPSLNAYMALSGSDRSRLRRFLSQLLRVGITPDVKRQVLSCLVPMSGVTLMLPAVVGDYSDFFAGIEHAKTAGKMFRPDNPLLPNYKHVPIAYHGRASSIRASGHPVYRPRGQRVEHGSTTPHFELSRRMDFELELAIWVRGGNDLGTPIPISEARNQIVGFGLLNDWSARDIQSWETQPLGPFLGKNFLTTVSPFVITEEALEPFRVPQPARPADDPVSLPYLTDTDDQSQGAFDIQLEVHLTTESMRKRDLAPVRITHASALDLYWTAAQMIAHHASNGCDLRAGDVLGSGTISSATPDGHGSLLEMTSAGRIPISLPSGETRHFLEAGDEIILSGWCERPGFARIGFGEARGRITDRIPSP